METDLDQGTKIVHLAYRIQTNVFTIVGNTLVTYLNHNRDILLWK